MSALTAGEQALVMLFRQRLEGEGALPQVRTLLYLACGVSGVEVALASFEAMFGLLARRARRVLGFHRATCEAVSADERVLLGLIAAHQAGWAAQAAGLARWLVPGAAADELGAHAQALARALAQRSRHVPVRDRFGRRGAIGSGPPSGAVAVELYHASH
ncbi:MAG: hypothetical protein GWN84_17410 [Gammaproteobacteria bacterium]|nr:hypothetical protein [Gammaproteobacteria bacterium]NIR84616.1 hypothetical protein [Gammaproteobacteria bacterium]NIR90519.1 hypothetical protein [Gammaproteobacteria bacterium]NIU05667.1 hypothetical protein [Gammaproteobacteria bacterium]NIV52806.1 hypothetical protein [Gammaproteobacteria bacterium]